MKSFLIVVCSVFIFSSCTEILKDDVNIHELDLEKRLTQRKNLHLKKSLFTYVPIYSEVYVSSDEVTRWLTATVSIHNMNLDDTLFINKADYYNSIGEIVRSYIEKPIFVKPMETIEIVVHESDIKGGTGANFLIEWKKMDSIFNPPLIESVMVSANGPRGLAFTSRGVILNGHSY